MRKKYAGEMVQADGSTFNWLGNGNCCIQGFVDDATGIPVGLYMTKNECLLGYLEAMRMMLINFGIPEQMYPDRSSIFFTSEKKSDIKMEKELTQFGRIVKELGIDMFPAYSPQAKGRIERFWQTIQSRLPVEFRIHNIRTMEEANEYLPVFMKKYAKRFGVMANKAESKFVEIGESDIEKINGILLVKVERKTDSSGVLSLNGYKFMIRDCIKKNVLMVMSEKDGIFAIGVKDNKRHEVELLKTNEKNRHLPEVQKILINNFFLRNTKGLCRDVNYDAAYDNTG
jgi:hypothetical protein